MTTEYELFKIVRYGFIPELFIKLRDHSSVWECCHLKDYKWKETMMVLVGLVTCTLIKEGSFELYPTIYSRWSIFSYVIDHRGLLAYQRAANEFLYWVFCIILEVEVIYRAFMRYTSDERIVLKVESPIYTIYCSVRSKTNVRHLAFLSRACHSNRSIIDATGHAQLLD